MSFAQDTKNELSRVEPEKKCCTLAEIAGFIRVAGSIMLAGFGKFKIRLQTENPAVARHYKKLMQDYFDIETNLEYGEGYSVKKDKKEKNISYIININPDNKSEQILRECGILLVKEGSNYFTDGIYQGIVKNKCCKKAYLRGMFLASGTVIDPAKGYDLEFVVNTSDLAKDLKKLIGSFVDLDCKIQERGKKYVVYMKKADYVQDTLALMGANTKYLEIQNIRILKSMKNKASHTLNCDMANNDRMIEAIEKQLRAIRIVDERIGLSNLPYSLYEIAKLRMDNPLISIEALGELCNPKLSKSGVNNRLRKIQELAK